MISVSRCEASKEAVVREADLMQRSEGLPQGNETARTKRSTRRDNTTTTPGRLAIQVLDQLPSAVAVIDDSLRLQYWNLCAARIFGIPATMNAESPSLTEVFGIATHLSPGQRERIVDFC